MLQWESCKTEAKDAVLLFRLGDFYEAFYDDAHVLSKELELTLTKRQEIPMAGIPFHASDSYIDKLIEKGYKVAIAEQMEDPKVTKGLVKREIVRIITPGTVINSSLISDKANNFIACLTQLNALFGLAVLDLTTADFRVIELDNTKELFDELFRLLPKEILVSEKCYKNNLSFFEEVKNSLQCLITQKEEWFFDHEGAYLNLLRHFSLSHLDGFGCKGMIPAVSSAGALLAYVQEDLNLSISHIKTLRTENLSQYMALDRAAQRHLELTLTLQGEKSPTLLHLLDKTLTPMGGRLIHQWLIHPLLCVDEINKRYDAISDYLKNSSLFSDLTSHFKEIKDLERLIMKIETGFAGPRDLVGLRFSLEQIPPLSSIFCSFTSSLIHDLVQFPDLEEIVSKIKNCMEEAPPLRLSDGNIIKAGYSSELDDLKKIKTDSHDWIASYQAHLKEKTGIKTLKVGFTKAFGYYIEVSRGQSGKMPEEFERRQTLVNAERFITPELKEYEHKVLTAEERILSLEQEIFHAIRKEVASHADKIRVIATSIASLDVLFSLARIAKEQNYTRPNIDNEDVIQIEEGRHPVIEASLRDESFIPNDVKLDQDSRLHLITGPNMAGKSTFIRQVAIITIMAQMGSFVPAKFARIGIVDKVFTRIGASDDLSRGQSTFMVEMAETANILNNATSRSLVILDEIGRGTSTYDGISIAWAVAEFLLTAKDKRAKTLFATHYWELTQLEARIPGAVNFTVAVHESSQGIVFLRKIIPGGTDKSYGIHVAKLAGLPSPVIKRAQEMLSKLEKNSPRKGKIILKKDEDQLNLFSP